MILKVVQARGLTPSGEFVDVAEADELEASFDKDDLAGTGDLLVFVERTGDKVPDPRSVGSDQSNASLPARCKHAYRIRLGAGAAEASRSLVVGRIRRASDTLSFELDARFIPQCFSMLAHSELHDAWVKTQAEVVHLAGLLAELHRTVARYADRVAARGLDVRSDLEILSFVERAVLALDSCAYETMDPTVHPGRFFQQVDRAARRVAIALDLSEATQLYFQTLAGADASYASLLEEERQARSGQRRGTARDDLRESAELAGETLDRIRRLVDALEAKYLDYRVNASLDTLRFVLDQDGEHFYVSVATPGHPQREGDVLTFSFSQLNLTGRHEYRVVLLGDPQGHSKWQVGEELEVDLRVNSAAGPGRPISRAVVCEIPGQRNFAVNFDTPSDVATISGLHVTVQPSHRVRGAILYQRRLGMIGEDALSTPRSAPPTPPPDDDGSDDSGRIMIRKPRRSR
ncbi:MAG: type VI secretion system baseplate subunit TssK [Planctomycetota bacterium]